MGLPNSFPTPRTIGRDQPPALRWGVIGTGNIASAFVPAVQRFTNQRIVAVASRTVEKANAFASRHGVETVHRTAQELVDRADVDVVYIATPDTQHSPIGLEAIAAGKHLLIEKPIAQSAEAAQALTDAAVAAGVLAMEGMWARYLPQYDVIRQLVSDGALGQPEFFLGSACRALLPPDARAGSGPAISAIAGMGIYPIAVSSEFMGSPTGVMARGISNTEGGDLTGALTLEHGGGGLSVITASVVTRAPLVATLSGSAARVDLEESFFNPTSFILSTPEKVGRSMRWSDPTGMTSYDGLAWEALALAHYVAEGRSESPLHTHAEMISIHRTIDAARSQLRSARSTMSAT